MLVTIFNFLHMELNKLINMLQCTYYWYKTFQTHFYWQITHSTKFNCIRWWVSREIFSLCSWDTFDHNGSLIVCRSRFVIFLFRLKQVVTFLKQKKLYKGSACKHFTSWSKVIGRQGHLILKPFVKTTV